MDAALDFNFDDLNKGRSYESPLTLAIHRNLLEIAKLLLDGGASVNRPDGSGRAAIHGTRSADTVKLLVSRGADINLADRTGRTPLITAVENGDAQALDALLANGARLDAPVRNGTCSPVSSSGASPRCSTCSLPAASIRAIRPPAPCGS